MREQVSALFHDVSFSLFLLYRHFGSRPQDYARFGDVENNKLIRDDFQARHFISLELANRG